MPSTPTVYDRRGRLVVVGRELGRAGEGVVLEVCDGRNLAAKIYHQPASPEKATKLASMVAQQSDRLLKLAAWPMDTLHDRPGGNIVGFLMPKAAQLFKIHDLYGVKSRMAKFPQANWGFLLHTASNLARAFRVVHEQGFVIGDVNEGNVFVTGQATVMLLDCDSFQATVNGKILVPGVGVENYTPPELQGQSFRGLVRTPDHDDFGLAVLTFLLLFLGRHPFSGGYLGAGDMPIGKAISEYRFAYGDHAQSNGMRPPPASLPLAAVSPPVASLFERAFLRPAGTPKHPRPTPVEWADALETLSKSLTRCTRHTGHVYWNGLTDCPWCRIEAAASVLLFPFMVPKMPQSSSFDTEAFWRQVLAIAPPPALPQTPPQSRGTASPSQWAVQQREAYSKGWGAFTSALGWNGKRNSARQRVVEALQRAQASRQTVIQRWQSQVAAGNQPFHARRQELEAKRQAYRNLTALREQKMRQLDANRRQSQLQKFLDSHDLWFAKVGGIGQGRKATLRSYGIETAADLLESTILNVPGFGPTFTSKLVQWRKSLESKFVYNPSQKIDPAEIARVEAEVAAERQKLEQELQHGLGTLQQIAQEMMEERQRLFDEAKQNLRNIAQAEADLRIL